MEGAQYSYQFMEYFTGALNTHCFQATWSLNSETTLCESVELLSPLIDSGTSSTINNPTNHLITSLASCTSLHKSSSYGSGLHKLCHFCNIFWAATDPSKLSPDIFILSWSWCQWSKNIWWPFEPCIWLKASHHLCQWMITVALTWTWESSRKPKVWCWTLLIHSKHVFSH